MDEISVYEHEEFGNLTVLVLSGEVFFSAADAAEILWYRNTREPLKKYCKKNGIRKVDFDGENGKTITLRFINENNISRLIAHSENPMVCEFEEWIFEEIIPSICRREKQHLDELEKEVLDPDVIIGIAKEIKRLRAENEILEAENAALELQNEIMKPKAEYIDSLAERKPKRKPKCKYHK